MQCLRAQYEIGLTIRELVEPIEIVHVDRFVAVVLNVMYEQSSKKLSLHDMLFLSLQSHDG